MAKLNRQLLVSSALSAGLVLGVVPGAAAAAPPEQSSAGGSDQGMAQRADQSQAHAPPAAPPADQAPAPQANAAATDNNAGGSAQAEANRSENANPAPSAPQGNPNPGQGNPNPAGPPGNNGTIKIDGVNFDDHPNNEPHPGCTFQIDFYGFDANQNVTVSFALQAPTTDGSISVMKGDTTLRLDDDDNSFGGSERGLDGSEEYTLAFPGVTPHPKQGYHVKVTVNAPGANGADTKHKVFWVSGCETTTPPSTGGTTPAGGTLALTTPAVGGSQAVQNPAAVIALTSRLAVLGEVIERSRAAEVGGTQLTAAPAAAGTNDAAKARVLGVTVERGALARTGLNAFQLLTLGAVTLLAGIASVRASRRKDTTEPPITI